MCEEGKFAEQLVAHRTFHEDAARLRGGEGKRELHSLVHTIMRRMVGVPQCHSSLGVQGIGPVKDYLAIHPSKWLWCQINCTSQGSYQMPFRIAKRS